MAQRRALKDAVKDPLVKKKTTVNRQEKPNPDNPKLAFKILFSLLLGFAGGLITGRFLKI